MVYQKKRTSGFYLTTRSIVSYLSNGGAVHSEGLEELRARAHGLRVLHDDTHAAPGRAVGDLDPVARQACDRSADTVLIG